MNFLFWLFFIGIIVASIQDLKRREVDNWLNLFLLVASFSYVLFTGILSGDSTIIFQASLALVVLFALTHLLYYGRIFAGGDAKLLFSMTAFFVGATFFSTIANIGIFVFSLMLSGSVYGIGYSIFLYSRNYKKMNRRVSKKFSVFWTKGVLFVGVIFFLLSYFHWTFLLLSLLAISFPFLYIFSKALEEVAMVRTVSGKNLREGDWLVDDIKVRGKVVKANWDGLSKGDIRLLKNKKRVEIKDGIPFIPAFFIAFILYFFFRVWLLGFFIF